LEPRKNLATVLAAFARLPAAQRARYPLVIAGGMGWRMDGFSRSLGALLASGEVRLTGYVGQQDLPLLYAGARMLVYPSLYEGFGLPPLEAMASGVPVIVSDRASLPEVVGDAALQVDALDEIALTEQITRLLEDDRLHMKLREAGLMRARQFSWEACARQTLAIYRAVLAQ
ncbi:MAG: glycosyltransferase family 4 protein, partial [Pseudomonadota bacterium]|nr:glycosyltransferase family 4 protein [Pseudomonadota bacterium]